jgi:hypothetical protein
MLGETFEHGEAGVRAFTETYGLVENITRGVRPTLGWDWRLLDGSVKLIRPDETEAVPRLRDGEQPCPGITP